MRAESHSAGSCSSSRTYVPVRAAAQDSDSATTAANDHASGSVCSSGARVPGRGTASPVIASGAVWPVLSASFQLISKYPYTASMMAGRRSARVSADSTTKGCGRHGCAAWHAPAAARSWRSGSHTGQQAVLLRTSSLPATPAAHAGQGRSRGARTQKAFAASGCQSRWARRSPAVTLPVFSHRDQPPFRILRPLRERLKKRILQCVFR
jgi:hypothetical protein